MCDCIYAIIFLAKSQGVGYTHTSAQKSSIKSVGLQGTNLKYNAINFIVPTRGECTEPGRKSRTTQESC